MEEKRFYGNTDSNNIFSTNTSGLKYNSSPQTDFSDKYSGRDYYEGTKSTDQSGVYLDLSNRQRTQIPAEAGQPEQMNNLSMPVQQNQTMSGQLSQDTQTVGMNNSLNDDSRFAPAQNSFDPSYGRGRIGEYRPFSSVVNNGPEVKPEVKTSAESAVKAEEKQPVTVQKKKKKLGFLKLTAAALVFGAVSGGAFFGVNKLLGGNSNNSGSGTEVSSSAKADAVLAQPVSDISGTAGSMNYDVAKIAADVQPSIVSITTTVTTTYQYYFQEFEQESTGAGSGIIIGKNDEQLYIATNYHVIEGATEINVGFCDGEIVKARIKGYDATNDIAVVTVDFKDLKDSTASAIKIAAIGDSDDLVVGEPVIAIGNALGYGQSVTVGYISALDRQIQGGSGSYIQTDAAINPGNSGGALINSSGQVIGVNSIKYVDSKVEGMGFSIPSNRAMSIIENIIEGKNGKTYLGITGADISKEYAQIYGFPEGIYVKTVESSSPANIAGIHTGDIIVEFDGKSVYTIDELFEMIEKRNDGDKVKITVYRADDRGNYRKVELEAELGFSVTSD